MTRDECELKIFKIVKELDSVIREYNPTNNHFSLFIDNSDGFVSFNNIYWHPKDGEDGTTDEKRPIHASGNIKETEKSPHLEGGMSHRSNRKKPRPCECCGRMIVKPKYEDQTICPECEEEIEEERYEPQW